MVHFNFPVISWKYNYKIQISHIGQKPRVDLKSSYSISLHVTSLSFTYIMSLQTSVLLKGIWTKLNLAVAVLENNTTNFETLKFWITFTFIQP